MINQKIPHRMIELGFEIIPLDGKKAFLAGGFHNSTHDRSVIDAWARRYRDCNWGGRRKGTLFVDIDPKNGGTIEALGGDTDTLTIRTGSGGLHLVYNFEGRTRGQLAQGVDLKPYATGYCVLAGSVHPDTGRPYVIERDIPIQPLPQRLLPLVEPQVWTPQPTVVSDDRRESGIVRKVAEAVGGGRNAVTFWAFCRAVERGSSSLIDEIRQAALNSGLPPYEVETCLRSAQRKGTVSV